MYQVQWKNKQNYDSINKSQFDKSWAHQLVMVKLPILKDHNVKLGIYKGYNLKILA